MQASTALHIELQLPAGFAPFVARRAFIALIDHRLADAPARVLASMRSEQVPCQPDASLKFELPWTPEALAIPACSLQAHISRSGSIDWSLGDFATTQSIPVAAGASSIQARLTPIWTQTPTSHPAT